MQTEFADIFSLLICDKSTFLQKIAPNIFTVCQNALIRPVKIMLLGPAITTVIAACGIVTQPNSELDHNSWSLILQL